MADIRPGQVWKKSDREQITVAEVDDTTVSGTLSDVKVGTTAVWVGSPADFDSLELITDAPTD